jgi:hypothetical protein
MIDWTALITNLQRKNIGVTKAASMAQVPAGIVADLARQRLLEPPFSVGVRLLDLHSDIAPERHNELLDL